MKKCRAADRQRRFGFKEPIVNSWGDCSGCRNPDDNELEPECRKCSQNEYYAKEGCEV